MSEENKKKSRGRPRKKKVEDEPIQEEEQSDINEADDTFGLPDIDLKPLDEVEETDEPEVEEQEEVGEETVEMTDTDTMDDDFEDDSEGQDQEKGDTGDSGGEDDVEGEQDEESFKPKYEYKEEGSAAPKIIMAIIGVLLIVGGIYYFGFYAPQQKAAAEKAKQEAAIQKLKDDDARQAKLERDRLAAEQVEAEAQADEVEEVVKLEPGEINILTEPSGRYYVIIGSFIDDDLAMDYGKKLSTEGIVSVILSPVGSTKFHRLALSDHGSWNEAQEAANNLKSNYSDQLWVLKY